MRPEGERSWAERRAALLREVEEELRDTASLTGCSGLSPRVRDALASVPRHEFVPPELEELAYANRALPIGCGQTISQPFIVAVMTELARLGPGDSVLEIGTGCGYQAAVLSRVAGRVYSLEILPELAEQARARLARLGCTHVEVAVGDGAAGWPEHAPFDAILVTAAPAEIPKAFVEQLRPGGRLVIPVGAGFGGQELVVLEKDAGGRVAERAVLPVAFVPLVSEPG